MNHVMSLMRTGKYEYGVTCVQLAKQWGMAERTARDITAEASKRVAIEVTERDGVTADVGAYLRWVVREARAGRKTARAGIQAAKVWAAISGAQAPQEIHVTAAAAATPATAKKAMEEAFGALLDVRTNADGDASAPGDVRVVPGAPAGAPPK